MNKFSSTGTCADGTIGGRVTDLTVPYINISLTAAIHCNFYAGIINKRHLPRNYSGS